MKPHWQNMLPFDALEQEENRFLKKYGLCNK
jgi:hypothetical protein